VKAVKCMPFLFLIDSLNCSRLWALAEYIWAFQNHPLIGWLKKYKIDDKILLYGPVTHITALLLLIVAIHI
jgi:hypothetical protein